MIRWKETMATGLHTIDQQHYELLSLINDLICLHQAGQSSQALDQVLPKLKTYMLFHFNEEEKLLARAAGGTGFEQQHLDQHRQFANEIDARVRHRAPQDDADIAENLGHYLESWWIGHIGSADQELARLVRAYGRQWL